VKKALLYIAGCIVVFALLFYLFFFLTLSGDAVTGEINRVVEKAGYEFRAERVKKELPLILIFEGVTITGPGNTDVLNFPEVVFQFKISEFFGQWPIRLSLRDRQNNDIDAGLSRDLNSLTLSGLHFLTRDAQKASFVYCTKARFPHREDRRRRSRRNLLIG
jgi:hypothetical protein